MPLAVTAPGPVTFTESGAVPPPPPPGVNAPATTFVPSIVIVQLDDAPVQSPYQPVNEAPELGVAVSVTDAPSASWAAQLPPLSVQESPFGPLIVPGPVTLIERFQGPARPRACA